MSVLKFAFCVKKGKKVKRQQSNQQIHIILTKYNDLKAKMKHKTNNNMYRGTKRYSKKVLLIIINNYVNFKIYRVWLFPLLK